MPMTREQLFEAWAPAGALWSAWAKPAMFAGMPPHDETRAALGAFPDLPWAPAATKQMGVVVELPALESVTAGLVLARAGFQPVPLFNTTTGANSALDLSPLHVLLCEGAEMLRDNRPLPAAPPAFLLDSNRLTPTRKLEPGVYDNRWVIMPQDLPSANFLLGHGISQMLVVQRGTRTPARDLALVLRRWQDGGIRLAFVPAEGTSPPEPLTVAKPRWFGALTYRALMLVGLRRNAAGGFGAVIPHPSSGTG